MKIAIDEEICKKLGMTLPEVLAVVLVKTGTDIGELFKELQQKQVIIAQNTLMGKTLLVTQRWDDVVSNILLSSDTSVPEEDRIERLASTLMQIFPQGKKDGTNTYWRGNIKDTKLKLKKFFKLYGSKYSDEQIITATRKYVKSFNGNYSYMRVLKYFIWKDVRKQDSEGRFYVEEVSDLATLIENAGHEEVLRDDWTSTTI